MTVGLKGAEPVARAKTAALAALLVSVALPMAAAEVTVFAASSLKTALDRIAAQWQADTGHQALIAYDSSAKLARQIIEGAPADVFLSAAEPWMDAVAAAELVQAGSRRAVLGNQLVLIGHGRMDPLELNGDLDLVGLLAGGKLAMGAVASVPVGQYGQQALISLGLWEAVAPQVAEVDSARAALALVATGEAGLGVVFGSDAVADDRAGDQVSVLGTFPADSHQPILYSLAVIAGANPLAAEFTQYLQADGADAVFADLGFTVLP